MTDEEPEVGTKFLAQPGLGLFDVDAPGVGGEDEDLT